MKPIAVEMTITIKGIMEGTDSKAVGNLVADALSDALKAIHFDGEMLFEGQMCQARPLRAEETN